MKWIFIVTDFSGEIKSQGILKAVCKVLNLDYGYVRKKGLKGYPIVYKERIIYKKKVVR